MPDSQGQSEQEEETRSILPFNEKIEFELIPTEKYQSVSTEEN